MRKTKHFAFHHDQFPISSGLPDSEVATLYLNEVFKAKLKEDEMRNDEMSLCAHNIKMTSKIVLHAQIHAMSLAPTTMVMTG